MLFTLYEIIFIWLIANDKMHRYYTWLKFHIPFDSDAFGLFQLWKECKHFRKWIRKNSVETLGNFRWFHLLRKSTIYLTQTAGRVRMSNLLVDAIQYFFLCWHWWMDVVNGPRGSSSAHAVNTMRFINHQCKMGSRDVIDLHISWITF